MPHGEDRFEVDGGLSLYEQWWLPERPATAVVALVHGFTEHGGRYAPVAAELNRRGYAVYALDLRGHGQSQGDRVFIRRFDDYLTDVDRFLERVGRREPGKPLFLFGHSMGGTIVGLYAAQRQPPVNGLVLSAPAAVVGKGVFPVLRRLASLFSRVFPKMRVVRMGSSFLSRDPEAVAEFQSDPLIFHDRFPVRTGAEILDAARRVQDEIRKVRLPLLILHGTGDRVAGVEGSRKLHLRAGSHDKTLHVYEGLYHEILREPEKEQVMTDLVRWLDARR